MYGIVSFNDKNIDILNDMLRHIVHRDYDNIGSYEDNSFSSEYVKLFVLGLSSVRYQPVGFENFVIVYTGKIYNYKEIREGFIKEGYGFNSNSNVEMVLKVYRKWGIKAIYYQVLNINKLWFVLVFQMWYEKYMGKR